MVSFHILKEFDITEVDIEYIFSIGTIGLIDTFTFDNIFSAPKYKNALYRVL